MADALAWKRSVASSPTTPKDVRCATATRYPKIPMVQMIQARGAVTTSLCRADAAGFYRSSLLLARVLPGQVRLHCSAEVVGVGQLIVLVGQERPAHRALGLFVV